MSTTKPKARLTLEQIWDADDIKTEVVDIPEWGGTVEVKALTKGEHQECRAASMKKGQVDADLLEINLLVAGLADPKMTKENAGQLKRKNAGVVERIMRSILRVSGLDENAVAEAERQFRD